MSLLSCLMMMDFGIASDRIFPLSLSENQEMLLDNQNNKNKKENINK